MFEISVTMDFSAAHNLRGYKGKCEKLHGHNWQVEVVFAAESLDKTGMLLDFNAAKKILKDILRNFDHNYLNNVSNFKKINPTSELIAQVIFQHISRKAKRNNYLVSRVNVWETTKNKAAYYE